MTRFSLIITFILCYVVNFVIRLLRSLSGSFQESYGILQIILLLISQHMRQIFKKIGHTKTIIKSLKASC